MSRLNFRRRNLTLERLESRALLSSGGPSAQEEYMIQLVNEARTNPAAAAERVTTNLTADDLATINHYGVDINQVRQDIASSTAQPPLAWNAALEQAALGHSQDMSNNGFQSHTGSDGSSSLQRMQAAGYGNSSSTGENAYAYATSIDQAMKAFLIDWGVAGNGHRANILQPNVSANDAYREVGIGIVNSSTPGMGPLVITQDFGSQNGAKADLLGVAFNDLNGTNFYAPGEGQGNVEIDATNQATGQTTSVETWDASGAYQMPLDPGSYQVTALVGNQVVRSQTVNIGTTNVEVDYNLSQPWQPQTQPQPQTTTPTPVVNNTPTPTPVVNSTPTPTPVVVVPIVTSSAPITPVATTTGAATPTSPRWGWNWTSWTAKQSN